MSLLLQPAEILLIGDFLLDLIEGSDGCPVILHWVVQSGAEDVYHRFATETPQTLAVRAHVTPVANHNVSGRPVARNATADVQDGDTVFLFRPGVDLTNKPRLWFEVPGMGNYVPEAKPPLGADPHVVLFPEATRMVQEIYCSPKRGV